MRETYGFKLSSCCYLSNKKYGFRHWIQSDTIRCDALHSFSSPEMRCWERKDSLGRAG